MKKLKFGLLLVLATLPLSSCIILPFWPDDSDTPYVTGDISVAQASELIAKAAKAYGSELDANGLRNRAGSELSNSSSSLNQGDMDLLLYEAFHDYMPTHIGARVFQGTSEDPSTFNLQGITRDSKKYTALTFLAERGLFTLGRNARYYNAGLGIYKSTLNTYLNRFHAYIGASKKDDFFCTVNRDYLYDNCQDEGKTSEDSVYRSDLISSKNVAAWAKNLALQDSEDFYATFLDMSLRKEGVACGLVDAVKTLTSASNVVELVSALKTMVKTTGYCPLWSDIKYGNQKLTVNGRELTINCVTADCYSNTATPSEMKPNSEGFRESVERFTPIFQEVLGIQYAAAKTFATNYTYFKYYYAQTQIEHSNYRNENWSTSKSATYGDGFNLYQFLQDCGVEDPTHFYWKNGANILSVLDMFSSKRLAYLKGMCIWQMLEHYIPCLPDSDSTMAWAHTNGYRHDEESLKNDTFYAGYVLPYLENNIYTYYINTDEYREDLDAVVGLVSEIKSTFAERAAKSSWLSASAPSLIRTKLNNMEYVVAGSVNGNSFMEYPTADFLSPQEGGTLYGNIGLYQKSCFDAGIKDLGTTWDKNDRHASFLATCSEYTPLFTNAFYVPWTNGIDISMGYLAAYDRPSQMSKEDLLATYGWVVGHEISHGFDASGVYYNENGKYMTKGWLSSQDQSAFRQRASSVSSMYEGVEVMPGQATVGATVLDEAIADITGLTISVLIGEKSEGFDFGKFFTKAAQSFASYASQSTYQASLAEDEHPFGRARVNTAFQSQDRFYSAFDIQDSDAMYLASANRAFVW